MEEKNFTKENTSQITEIHKTEFVDKSLPSIFFEKTERKSTTEASNIIIQVSDKTSKDAFDTFKKLRDEINKE